MLQEYIVVRPSAERDPDGAALRETWRAHLALGRTQARRDLMVHLLALLSLPMALLLAFSGERSSARRLLVAVWAMCLTGIVVALASERKYRRTRAALLAKLDRGPRSTIRCVPSGHTD